MPRAPTSLVLAIDIGSSSVRSALFSENGTRIVESSATRKYSIRYTTDDGAELDAPTLLRATRSCARTTLRFREANFGGVPLRAVSGSGFWHSLLGVDGNGTPVTPIFTWADSRSAPDAAQLRSELSERMIQRRTGCMLRAPFWLAKLRWIKRTDPRLFTRVRRWLSPAVWIFEQLFGAAGTSHSMASGTGLYNLQQRRWDRALCEMCGVREEILGAISDSTEATKFIRNATVFAAIGDGAASNLRSGAGKPGTIAINIGTSAAVRAILPNESITPEQLPHGLFHYVVDKDRRVVGGAVSNAGNLHEWCLRELKLRDDAEAEEALSRVAASSDDLIVLPFWVPERAPTWPQNMRGAIVGLRPITSAADVLRATTTSVFYRLAAILDQLEQAIGEADEVIVSGGILHSPASLAILADCLGRDIRVCREMEGALRGAAIYALQQLGCGVTPLPAGNLVRHRATLAAKHRTRRKKQETLERQLG